MDWGMMQGLGQGLMNFGNTITKQALDEKLRKAREAREDQLEERRFARQQNSYDKTIYEEDGDGVLWEVKLNKGGNEQERKLAPKNKVDELVVKKEEARLDNEYNALRIQDLRDKVAAAPEDRNLRRDLLLAQIESQKALTAQRGLSGQASMIRAQNSGRGSSSGGGLASVYSDDTTEGFDKALAYDEATKANKTDIDAAMKAGFSRDQIERTIDYVAEIFAQGTEPGSFNEILRRHLRANTKATFPKKEK